MPRRDQQTTDPLQLTAIEWFTLPHGCVAVVRLPGEWRDPSRELAGAHVEIDGRPYVCRGVDVRMHAPPFGRGEPVTMLAEPPHAE